jgi:hypothetical protein
MEGRTAPISWGGEIAAQVIVDERDFERVSQHK